MKSYKQAGALAAIAVASLLFSGCAPASPGEGDTDGGTIAFLLPELVTTRYEQFDRPFFTDALSELCPDCELLYENAGGDASKQLAQAEQVLANGAEVLVLGPVDATAAGAITELAEAKGVPVVAYNRVPDGQVEFAILDSLQDIGRQQAEALLAAIEAGGGDPLDGQIVVINGDAATTVITQIIEGRDAVLDGKVNIGKEFFTTGWDPANAQQEMEQAITALGKDNIIGVYSMNDGMSGGIAAALEAAGFDPFPPVTGLDGDVPALQRILVGRQSSTLIRPYAVFAQAAAEAAVALLRGESLPATDEVTVNGTGLEIPTVYPALPVIVTIDNIQPEVIDKGYIAAADICTPDFAAACEAAGIEF